MTLPLEPIALKVVGAPEAQVLQRDVPIRTPGLRVEIVDASGDLVRSAPTALVHLCVRVAGHTAPCTFGSPNLLASATAFAGYPGGVALFDTITISTAAVRAIGAEDGMRLFFEAATELLNPGRTSPTTDALLPGQAAQLAFVDAFDPCLLYTSPSPRDRQKSRMPSSA